MRLDFIYVLLISLGLSLIFELLFEILFGIRNIRELLLVVLVNTLTNPAVVLLHYLIVPCVHIPAIIIVIGLEITAVLVEALCYRMRSESIKYPLLFSLGANAFSFSAGYILNRAFT